MEFKIKRWLQIIFSGWMMIASCVAVQSQTLQFGNLDLDWTVCGQREVTLELTNTSGESMEDIALDLQLPCGVIYVTGSVAGGTELDITNTQQPIFQFDDLDPGMVHTLAILCQVTCDAVNCIDAGQLFSMDAQVGSSLGVQEFPSDPFNVETGRLVVTAIEQPYIAAGKHETVPRTLKVRNTRLGRLTAFDLEDRYPSSLIIYSADGMDNGSAPQVLRRRFTGTDFQQIGNKDEYFDFNEELVITEVIEVISCAYEAQQALSSIRLSWGCGGSDCQVVERQALVDIQAKSEPGDLLTIENAVPIEPACYDGDGIWQSMVIQNTGAFTDLRNLTMIIDPKMPGRGVEPLTVSLVSLNGQDTIPVQVNYRGNIDTLCSVMSKPVFSILVPELLRMGKYRLNWKMTYCQRDGCNPRRSHWTWKYAYEKECAPEVDRLISGEGSTGVIGERLGKLDVGLTHTGVGQASDGDTIFMAMHLTGSYMKTESGLFEIAAFVPCGFLPLDTDFKLNGKNPLSVEKNHVEGGSLIQLTYSLPFSVSTLDLAMPLILDCDSVCTEIKCKKVLLTSCIEKCSGESTTAKFFAQASWQLQSDCPVENRPRICSPVQPLIFDCSVDECYETLPGYYRHELSIVRTTLGLPDNDDNGTPELNGTLDMGSIRLDRAITYDSFEVRLHGQLVMDVPGTTFAHAIYLLDVRDFEASDPKVEGAYRSQSLGQNGKLKPLDRSLHIFDRSDNIWYYLDTFPIRFGQALTKYYFDFSIPVLASLNPGFPLDFVYEDGDSIIMVLNNRVDVNVLEQSKLPGSIYLKYSGNLFLDSKLMDLELLRPDIFPTCDCRQSELTVYGLRHWAGTNVGTPGSGNYCEGQSSAYGHFTYDKGRFGNFFPKEVRPSVILDTAFITVDTSLIHPYQIRINWQNFNIETPQYVADVSEFGFEQQNEELNWGGNAIYFDNAACISKEVELGVKLRFFVYPKYQDIYESEFDLVRPITLLYPLVDFHVLFDNLFANNESVAWDLQIKNKSVISSFYNLITRNNWVVLRSPNGRLTNLDVINPKTGQSYPQINGIWQLTDIPPDSTLQVAITATNTSCEREVLYVQYGWNCEPFTDLDQEPCVVFYDTLSVISAPGLLELQPDPDTISGPLCSAMPETHILFINADQGAVYDLAATVTLPKGLSYQSGSTLLVWPAGSGNIQPVIDPQVLVDGRLLWTLTDFLPELAEGLPGVNSTPENSLELHFQTESDCDFVVGSRIITRFSGSQICGKPTNASTKVSGPYSISGASSPYAVSIAVNLVDSSLCEDIISVNLTLNTSEIVGNQDKLVLELPPGFSYQTGSCQTNLTPSEPIQQNNQLIWILQEGLATTTLNLSLQISEEVLCETVIMPIYTTTETSAFCVEEGKDCSVAVITGSRYLPFQIDKPAYELVNLTPGWVNGQIVLSGDLFQTGGTVSGIGSIQVVLDENQNGVFDAGDSLVGEYPFMFTDTDSLHLALFGVDLAPEDWCHLLVVIDADANCACTTTTVTLDGPILFPEFIQTPLCAGDSLVLGRPEQPGVTYHWLTKDLSCTDCAEQVLQWSDPGSNAKKKHYWLRESRADGCTIELEFVVTMQPRPGFYQDSMAICEGDTATLLTSPGQQWTWAGPAQLGGGQQSLLVSPTMSSTYTVTMTDDFGCSGVDTAIVSVLALPIAAAGPDVSYCFGAEARLQAMLFPGWSYNWTNGYDRLSDVQKTDPLILLQEPYTYILEVDNGQCRSTDQVTINFYDGFDIAGLPDTFRACLGDTAIFILEGAASYQWQPYYTWLCKDPDCTMVSIPVNGPSTYTVTAQNEMGCEDERSVVVLAEPELIWMGDSLSICAGSSVEIFGETVSEAGQYCDTIYFDSGCLEVTCVSLILEDGPVTFFADTICLGDFLVFQGDTLSLSGQYCITLTSVNGCDSLVCLTLLASPAPLIHWTVDQVVLCPGDSFTIEPVVSPFESEFVWTDSYPLLSRSVVGKGTYTLRVTNACGQVEERTFQADLAALPLVDVGMDSTICEESEILVAPEISDGVVDWYWSDGSIALERMVTKAGLYVLTVEDTCQQEAVDSLQIEVERCVACPVQMPNVFSPNNDGVNDLFTYYSDCEVEVKDLQVFNRWGDMVYQGRGHEAGWNGMVNGRAAPMDVYVFILVIDDPVDGERLIRGDVTLVR